MSKKVLSIVMSLVVVTSLIGCGDSKKEEKNTKKQVEASNKIETEDKLTEGKWAKNYTLDETKKLYEDKLAKMENITKEFGLKYSKDDVIKSEDDTYIAHNSIYFNNENADPNKIENMYFGLKLYGEDLESGVISLKLILKFDSENAIKNNDFDLGKTSFAKYIYAFTDEENRDFSDINKEIIEKLKDGEKEVRINNTIDGLQEEIIADKECIFYKLSTKKYKFADAEMSME